MIETRKDEVIFAANEPALMLNYFLYENVYRTWTESFINEDTGEVVEVERKELVMPKGTLLDKDNISVLMFFIQSGDIKSVTVSNQKRCAYEGSTPNMKVWLADCMIATKKRKIILYANGITNALEIVKDYIELYFKGVFFILSIKELSYAFILEDNLSRQKDKKEESDEEKRYFQMDLKVSYEYECSSEETFPFSAKFIVKTFSVEDAFNVITNYLQQCEENSVKADITHNRRVKFSYEIEKINQIALSYFIPKEFSLAYQEENK